VRDRQQQTVKAQIEARQPAGRHSIAESDAVGVPPGMLDLDDLENLEDEVRAVAPAAAVEVQQARELAREFASEGSEFQKQAAEAARRARELQTQVLEHKEEWQRELRQLGPQMQELQRELKSLRDDSRSFSEA
jgi:hypothetical protein